jgi:Tfp pilus assembly protein FimV
MNRLFSTITCHASLLRAIGTLVLAISFNAAAAGLQDKTAPLADKGADLSALKASHSYTPALGETLERIVAKTIPDSPLSLHLLSEAFVALNPQAFGTTKPQRTLSTNALKVPNHNQLVHLVLLRLPADAPTAKPIPAPAPSRPPEKRETWLRYAGGPIKTPSSFDASAEERRNWVQYLGAALPRNWMGEPAAQAESRQWVQYPSAARAASVAEGTTSAKTDAGKWVQYPISARASAPAALPESRLDTGNWVRYVATRFYPQQQFAQLLD